MEQFIKAHAPEFINNAGVREKPVLMVEVDQPSVKKLMLEILDTSVTPYNPDSTPDKLFYQVINLLHECNTKMLVIDEIQSLYQGTPREVTAITRFIKRLSNKTGISITGVGVTTARQLLKVDEQYANRFVAVTMPRWEASVAFQQFLMGFESCLPLKLPSGLSSPEISAVILEKSEGNTARIEELVLGCARQAIITGRERIDLEMLRKPRWTTDSFGTREAVL
ncbi:Bacterial TniB protein [compost metagenome]